MFITNKDYKVVIGEVALKVVSQTDDANRANAESEAMEEIAGYLRPKYDCGQIFSAEGDGRNKLIVMYTCDIALYHLTASGAARMGSAVRKERYERAIEWLKGVQAGKVVPDLPLAGDDNGKEGATPWQWGSERNHKHIW